MKKIYLDNSATTQPAPEVLEIMHDIQKNSFGNPSSIHSFGQKSLKILDKARRDIANFLECSPREIVFTSGGSESDNLAIKGIVDAVKKEQKPHVITSQIEHHAVLKTIQELEKEGKIEATYLNPDTNGLLDIEDLLKAIKPNTALISIIYVNNETGVVQPIAKIGQKIQQINKKRLEQKLPKIYFHTDAVQATEFFDIRPEFLNVDLLTFTGHKIHGPKGVGVLYIKKGTPLTSQIDGGGQEFRLRAGTENVAGIAGLAKAIELIIQNRTLSFSRRRESLNATKEHENLPELIVNQEVEKIISFKKTLTTKLTKIPNSIINGTQDRSAPHILNISFLNLEGEAIILGLDLLGIAISSGSACNSRALEPSHVLTSMGLSLDKTKGSVRISMSRYTTREEVETLVKTLPSIIQRLRKINPR